MKIEINKSIRPLSEDEKAQLKENATPAETDPEEFKRQILGCDTVIFSEQVLEDMKAIGITPDELVARLLKKAGAQQ